MTVMRENPVLSLDINPFYINLGKSFKLAWERVLNQCDLLNSYSYYSCYCYFIVISIIVMIMIIIVIIIIIINIYHLF